MNHSFVVGVVSGIPDDQVVVPSMVSGIKLKLLREPNSNDKIFEVTVNNHIDVDPEYKRMYGCLMSPHLANVLGLDMGSNDVVTGIESEKSTSQNKPYYEIKLPVVFSVKFSPSECKRMLEEYVNEFYGHVRFYKENISNTNINHFQTRMPFGKITHIDETDVGYIVTIIYDEIFDLLFDNYRHGTEELLCHPTVMYDKDDESMLPRIAWISLLRQNELTPNMTYDGIHDKYRHIEEDDNNE